MYVNKVGPVPFVSKAAPAHQSTKTSKGNPLMP
jgi:hypothetical protein